MADNMAEAFSALERLDDEGREALRLAGAMWEEILQDAIARTQRAEYLLWRLHDWAFDRGLDFDVARAAAEWDADHERRPLVLLPWFEAFVAARTERLQEMRVRFRRSCEDKQRDMLRTRRKRARAEAAEAERDALLVEIERLRAPAAQEATATDPADS